MLDPHAHYRIVYTGQDGSRIVSMSHMALDAANSLAALVDARAKMGRFTVEDEFSEQEQSVAA